MMIGWWGRKKTIIDGCDPLACEFLHTLFEHCNREANTVAHELASMGASGPVPDCDSVVVASNIAEPVE